MAGGQFVRRARADRAEPPVGAAEQLHDRPDTGAVDARGGSEVVDQKSGQVREVLGDDEREQVPRARGQMDAGHPRVLRQGPGHLGDLPGRAHHVDHRPGERHGRSGGGGDPGGSAAGQPAPTAPDGDRG